MEKPIIYYQPVRLIKDEKFSVDEIYKYNICFKISNKHCMISVFDTSTNRCLVYEQYEIEKSIDFIDFLEQIYKDHAFVSAGYWKKIILMCTTPSFTYVPEEYFSKENALNLLRLNTVINIDEVDIFHSPHPHQHIYSIFTIEKKILRWIKGKYPYQEIICVHENSAVLEGLIVQPNQLEMRNLHAFIDEKKLTLFFFKHGNLYFLNTFPSQTTKDLIYYVLLIITQLELIPSEVSLVLYGDILAQDNNYNELRKYINRISFGQRPKELSLGFKFDEIAEHTIFDVLSVGNWIK
ncbi:MAG: DUF3822 family protein [Thermoflexibacter sp.]|nr:DUF3822 family protein [Thermoflexibacter sp.]